LLQRSQWYYECACGFKVGHTVAAVTLSEDVMRELLENGRTKEKISGFVSKAGNTFEACLKFMDDRTSFDFENLGAGQQKE
ncbi:topoisomerase C-terminal repeat-containing protein, partial [Escherichia coli]|uniref:topoisomerase C-terminal repeat-containing protein n=1 Tax=Escherichia coli TaxID=562 RepID=UPI0027390358